MLDRVQSRPLLKSFEPIGKIGILKILFCHPSLNTLLKISRFIFSNSFPPEKADVLIGSDLVYDERILSVLIPAVTGMLKEGE